MTTTSPSQSFWFDNCCNFFSTLDSPLHDETFEQQMNNVTKLIVLTTILILCLFTPKAAVIFLTVSIFISSFVYYMGRNFMKTSKECYGNVESLQQPVQPLTFQSPSNNIVLTPTFHDQRKCQTTPVSVDGLTIKPNTSNLQLIDGRQSAAYQYQGKNGVPLDNNVSLNQKLAGTANPKTLVQPIIPSPMFDFDSWQPTDFVIPTAINDQKNQELYYNGYVTPTTTVPTSTPNNLVPLYKAKLKSFETYPGENNTDDSDYVNTGCGYHPQNLQMNLPVNYQNTALQNDPAYNANLFSIPLQPDLYTTSQVNQNDASMSNLGISYTQQLEPTILEPKNGYQEFVELDPLQNKISTKSCDYNFANQPESREIYDPRTTGYGTQARSYIDPLLGQPKYYYKDIDQQRNNGYLTRNNIDFANFGTSTGVYPGNNPLEDGALHDYADETFTNSVIGQRTELQQRLLHKNSNRAWQQRVAPIRTNVMAQTPGSSTSRIQSAYAGPRG